jgi:hypothetical protein
MPVATSHLTTCTRHLRIDQLSHLMMAYMSTSVAIKGLLGHPVTTFTRDVQTDHLSTMVIRDMPVPVATNIQDVPTAIQHLHIDH